MDKIIPWLVPAVLGGMGIGTYLFLWGREWARRRWQYEAIRRRMLNLERAALLKLERNGSRFLPPDAARASWAAKRRVR